MRNQPPLTKWMSALTVLPLITASVFCCCLTHIQANAADHQPQQMTSSQKSPCCPGEQKSDAQPTKDECDCPRVQAEINNGVQTTGPFAVVLWNTFHPEPLLELTFTPTGVPNRLDFRDFPVHHGKSAPIYIQNHTLRI